MTLKGHYPRLLGLLIPAILPFVCTGSTFSFAGNFSADNQEQFFTITTGATNTVRFETFSYGGGTQPGGTDLSGNVVLPGGFSPALSVFDSTGALIAQDVNGGTAPANCNGRAIDPTTHFCEDAFIFDTASVPLTLPAGTFTVVLTQQGNVSDGTLSDGFTYDAKNLNDPSYTGTNAGLPGRRFIDQGDNMTQRTGHFDVSFTGLSLLSVTTVPEPSSVVLMLAGCSILALAFVRRGKLAGTKG